MQFKEELYAKNEGYITYSTCTPKIKAIKVKLQ